MFVVRADSPYHRIATSKGGGGLRRRRLRPGDSCALLLDGIGLKQDADFKAVYLERAGDGPRWSRTPCCGALGRRLRLAGFHRHDVYPAGARFIAPSEEEIRAIQRVRFPQAPDHSRRQLPEAKPGHHLGGSWSFVLALTDFPDGFGLPLTRALHKGQNALGQHSPQAREAG